VSASNGAPEGEPSPRHRLGSGLYDVMAPSTESVRSAVGRSYDSGGHSPLIGIPNRQATSRTAPVEDSDFPPEWDDENPEWIGPRRFEQLSSADLAVSRTNCNALQNRGVSSC